MNILSAQDAMEHVSESGRVNSVDASVDERSFGPPHGKNLLWDHTMLPLGLDTSYVPLL